MIRFMDERAEIWIARDPETNSESKPVSLRKLRKGVRIGRLSTSMLVTRVGSSAWVTLERLLADAMTMTPPPTVVVIDPIPNPTPTPAPAPAPSPDATDSIDLPAAADETGDAQLTAMWFAEEPPEPDDDEPIFVSQSLLDLNFERVMTTKLVKLTYVLLLATLAVAVLASLLRVFAALASGNGQQIATAIVMVPVVVLACAVIGAFGRMMLEVLLAVFRIAARLTKLSSV